MSLNQITHDVFKPWLNVRCNNLTVDGTITGGGITPVPVDESVTVRGVIPDPGPGTFPVEIIATLLPTMLPVPNSWYSLQYLVFLQRSPILPENTRKAKLIDVNVIVYVDADFRLSNAGVNEWTAEWPGPNAIRYTATYDLPIDPAPPLAPYQTRVVIRDVPGFPIQTGMPYDYAFVVSDARRLV